MADPVSDLIKTWPEPQQAIAARLREIILGLDAGLGEDLKWNMPAYYLDSNVCSIICHKDHVNLQFFKGAELQDPNDLLEGTGKSMRHIKIYDTDDVDSKIISAYVEEAAGLS